MLAASQPGGHRVRSGDAASGCRVDGEQHVTRDPLRRDEPIRQVERRTPEPDGGQPSTQASQPRRPLSDHENAAPCRHGVSAQPSRDLGRARAGRGRHRYRATRRDGVENPALNRVEVDRRRPALVAGRRVVQPDRGRRTGSGGQRNEGAAGQKTGMHGQVVDDIVDDRAHQADDSSVADREAVDDVRGCLLAKPVDDHRVTQQPRRVEQVGEAQAQPELVSHGLEQGGVELGVAHHVQQQVGVAEPDLLDVQPAQQHRDVGPLGARRVVPGRQPGGQVAGSDAMPGLQLPQASRQPARRARRTRSKRLVREESRDAYRLALEQLLARRVVGGRQVERTDLGVAEAGQRLAAAESSELVSPAADCLGDLPRHGCLAPSRVSLRPRRCARRTGPSLMPTRRRGTDRQRQRSIE